MRVLLLLLRMMMTRMKAPLSRTLHEGTFARALQSVPLQRRRQKKIQPERRRLQPVQLQHMTTHCVFTDPFGDSMLCFAGVFGF